MSDNQQYRLLRAPHIGAGQEKQFPHDNLVVVPNRYPGRWISATVCVLLLFLLAQSMVSNDNFGWPIVGRYLFSPIILSGLWVTVWLTAVIMLLAVALGVAIATLRLSANPLVSRFSSGYIWFFRGTPVLVQLIFWYNLAALYPQAYIGIPHVFTLYQGSMNDLITPYTAAILGLGLNEAAYMAEIVRAGLASVDNGQQEAARALGMNKGQWLRRIILPQAIPFIIPPTGNQVIGMLKTTSLVSVISLSDLLYSAQSIYSRTFENIPLLIVTCIWYLLATTLLSWVQVRIEKAFRKGR
ncbi:amino acid ABC transporter permease [Martelella alba]|uniref:Amino acid ABC transporter permease n=1 Tax=Martelella alba TaxID=2590451 RepID=A0ABY2SKI7_9HYPH|nr:amino acid ABC transporter permease [Martelella alba]TKI05307.1 amino acid ABC transporter permease [Martelella alba]